MALATSRKFSLLYKFLIAVNALIISFGAVITGLGGSTLSWATGYQNAVPEAQQILYFLKMDGSTDLVQVYQYPESFTLKGTNLLLAAGMVALFTAWVPIAFVINTGMKATKPSTSVSRAKAIPLLLLMLVSIVTLFFLMITLMISWTEYYKTDGLDLSLVSADTHVYQADDETPESWLQALHQLASPGSNPNYSRLSRQYTVAAVGRILVLPLFILQAMSVVGVLILKERIRPAARSPASARNQKEVRLERARSEPVSEAGSDVVTITVDTVEIEADGDSAPLVR